MIPHHTKNKGDLAVLKAAADLAEQGFLILFPSTEHAPFDLVAYRAARFLRIQVRYAKARRGRVEVHFSTSYADRTGNHRRKLDRSHVDVVCVYCPDTGACYYIEAEDGGSATLRLSDAANGQRLNVRRAELFTKVPQLAP